MPPAKTSTLSLADVSFLIKNCVCVSLYCVIIVAEIFFS